MIWKRSHIQVVAESTVQKYRAHFDDLAKRLAFTADQPIRKIGIVGGGPKGLYALERLLHNLQAKPSVKTEIFWINSSEDFGSGNNYRTTQPDALLINYCIGNIDAWDREKPAIAIAEQHNLVDWIAAYNVTENAVAPTDYASRALVGCYLQDTMSRVLQHIPADVKVNLLEGTVEDIRFDGNFELFFKDQLISLPADYILLTTGHCYENARPTGTGLYPTDKTSPVYLSSAYPIEKLDAIPGSSQVAIMGMGLTWIDACLQLTEGRGGKFDKSGVYLPSGLEPVLLPFSRSGLPIMPRGPIYGQERYKLRDQTVASLEHFALRRSEQAIDFVNDVYPVLEAEVQYAYYSTKLCTSDPVVVEKYMQELAPSEVFCWDTLLFPDLPDSEDHHSTIVQYIRSMIAEASLGELRSPLMAAAAVWREATPLIGNIYAFGGFTGSSQRVLDTELWSAYCRTSFGPPIANMKKMLALAEAGVMRFTKNPLPKEEDETLQMSNYLIDARIARARLQPPNSTLYGKLLERGLLRAFDNDGYQPGCIDINAEGHICTSGGGAVHNFAAYGTPTEGILFDNDSLSRKRNDLASVWAEGLVAIPATQNISTIENYEHEI